MGSSRALEEMPAVAGAPGSPRRVDPDARQTPAPLRPGEKAGTAELLRWTRLGTGMVAAGYAVVSVHGLFRSVDRTPEILTAFVAAAAFALSQRHTRLAGAIALVTVWAEVAAGVLGNPNPRTSGVLVYPVLATAAGFLLGGREAVALAASCVAVMALDATLDGAWATTDTTHWVLVSSLLTIGSAFLARAVRRSYGAVLLRSEAARRRYADLFASAPDGLVALGTDGRVVEVNAAAAALLGASPAALEGMSIQRALRSAGAAADVDLAAASNPGSPLPVALERGGGRISVEISARAEGEDGGVADGQAILVLRDVTQRRLVEERLGHAQRLESVGQLAGGVAHDFNNLLTAVSSGAAVLAGHADPGVRELAGEIVDAGRRGAALTRQLLAFARRDVRRPETLDLSDVVTGMARLLGRVLGTRHPLAVDAPGAVPVFADRAQLEQVALNLVANARDAMPDGGPVSVSIRLLDRAAAGALGSTLAATRQALLEVKDSGVGMTPEIRARIFEPFFSTKARGEGTGLGLATVHGIAAQSGGQVTVESAPGRGSAFRVFLPAADGAPEAA